MRLFLVLLLFIAFAASVEAQCGTPVVRRVVPHCPPKPVIIVEDPPVIAVPAVVPILVPAFSFQFVGGGNQAPLAPAPVLPGPGPVPPPTPAPVTPAPHQQDDWPVEPVGQVPAGVPGDHVALLNSKCASCHTEPGSGGFSLFTAQGSLYPGADLVRAYNAVHSGKMPKRGSMTHEEKVTLFNAASRQGR
jgi:hypothetical protein